MSSSSDPHQITFDDFRARAATRLLTKPPANAFDPGIVPLMGDHRLAEMLAPEDGALHRPAAVLIPIIARSEGATILLTKRAAHLKDHAGQVAFPGGKMDQNESDPVETAIREAEEEIGLGSPYIEPLGYLEPYLSSTGFRIVPVVASINPSHHLSLDHNEVETTFEVPLAFLMNPAHHETHSREWRGALRRYYAMPYNDHYIWGVTAGIIRNLYEKVYSE